MANETLSQIQELNSTTEDWSKKTEREIILLITKLNIRQKGVLYRSIRSRVGYRSGVADKVSIKMKRYGFFRAKGVGRGTKIHQVGTTNRTPAPFYGPVIDKNLPSLANIVAEIFADSSVKALKF